MQNCKLSTNTSSSYNAQRSWLRQLTTAAGLVQKCAVLFAVGSVWGRIAFSPQTNRSRVCLKAYRDHLFKEVSVRLFGLLLVRTRVRLLHSHLPKRTAPRGKTNSCDSTELNEAGVKAALKRMHEAGIKCVCLQADTLFFLWMFCVFR